MLQRLAAHRRQVAPPTAGWMARSSIHSWRFAHLWKVASPKEAIQAEGGQDSLAEKMRRLEAVLFLAPQAISSRRAAHLASLADATEVRTLVRRINQVYDQRARPYRVEEVAGGLAILTRPDFAPWLRKLSYLPGEVRLGRSALETLAVVAYRQPVPGPILRPFVEWVAVNNKAAHGWN